MKIAIMQPYFFPYIGYFQLMKEVDRFVFYDDAQYMKGGWVNRNRILLGAAPAWLTAPVAHGTIEMSINQRYYLRDGNGFESLGRKLEAAYRKAPYFNSIFPRLKVWLKCQDDNVARFNQFHLVEIARLVGIRCEFLTASSVLQGSSSRGQDRVIEICQALGATEYVNPIGGLELYSKAKFAAEDIVLSFLKARATGYPQHGDPHVPFLSIIDVLMFNPLERLPGMLEHFDRVPPLGGVS